MIPSTNRVLCKYRGMLVIAEVNFVPGNGTACPDCRCGRLAERSGWYECDQCGFAYLMSDVERICGDPLRGMVVG